MTKSNKLRQELIETIAQLDIEGYDAKCIASRLDLTPQRIYQIFKDDDYLAYLKKLEDSQKDADNSLVLELAKYKKSLIATYRNYLKNEFEKFLKFNSDLQKYSSLSGEIYENICNNLLSEGASGGNLIDAKASNLWLSNAILASNSTYDNLLKIAKIMHELESKSDEQIREIEGTKKESGLSLSEKLDSILDSF